MAKTNASPEAGTDTTNMNGKRKAAIAYHIGMKLADLEAAKICWVPLIMDDTRRELMLDVANVRTTEVGRDVPYWTVAARIMETAFVAATPELEQIAKKSNRAKVDDLSAESIQKELERMQKKADLYMQALNAKLAAMKKPEG